jgi:predicted PurR-regulated permease PerM
MKNFFTGLFMLVIFVAVVSTTNIIPGLSGQFRSVASSVPSAAISQEQLLSPALINKLMSGTQAFWQLALKLVDYLRSGQWRETTSKAAAVQSLLVDKSNQTPDYLKSNLDDFSKFLEQHGTASTTKAK